MSKPHFMAHGTLPFHVLIQHQEEQRKQEARNDRIEKCAEDVLVDLEEHEIIHDDALKVFARVIQKKNAVVGKTIIRKG